MKKKSIMVFLLLALICGFAFVFIYKNLPSLGIISSSLLGNPEIVEIRTGTSFGECLGYCKTEMVINSKMITFAKTSPDNSKPEIKQEVVISAEEWASLVAAVNKEKFSTLPEAIGCPDCADGGAEWIEIFDGKLAKRVTLEYGTSIPEVNTLIEKLRRIREDISAQFD